MSVYKADTTPLVAYVNTHIQLEARRDVALANQDYGPRVLIVGDADHGRNCSLRELIECDREIFNCENADFLCCPGGQNANIC